MKADLTIIDQHAKLIESEAEAAIKKMEIESTRAMQHIGEVCSGGGQHPGCGKSEVTRGKCNKSQHRVNHKYRRRQPIFNAREIPNRKAK